MTNEFILSRRQTLRAMGAAGFTALVFPSAVRAQGATILRARSYADLQVLDPAYRKAAPEDDIMRCIFNGLVRCKSADLWEWELDAAESIEQIDAKTIAFKLRPGIKFSGDFGEITAEDVKFSYERIADPAKESPYKDDWTVLDHVEVKDALSGVIHLKEPFAALWTSTLPTGSGLILSKKAVEAAGGKFETTVPAWSGRYMIKEWQPKQRTVLVRNPDWTGPQSDFDEIHILPIEDEKTAELGFEAGDLDFTWVSVSSIPRYLKEAPKGGKFVRKPSLAYVWLGMNMESEPFTNPKVRRAVQHAIDPAAVVDAAYFGAAEPATGIVAPGLAGHRDKTLYGYDPAKAKELLKEAGMESGFSCTLDILNKIERANAAQAIQSQLAEVGITVTIQQHDSGTFWSLGDEKSGDAWKKLQLIVNRFSMQPDPSWATAWFTPDQIGVWNWERFNNPEFGELHKQGLVEIDEAKRDEMYKRMQDLMEESGAYVFLTHEAVGIAYRDTVNPGLQPNGSPNFVDFKKA
jgi:peptide/nickel transport system substrate-binding protein